MLPPQTCHLDENGSSTGGSSAGSGTLQSSAMCHSMWHNMPYSLDSRSTLHFRFWCASVSLLVRTSYFQTHSKLHGSGMAKSFRSKCSKFAAPTCIPHTNGIKATDSLNCSFTGGPWSGASWADTPA